MLKDKKGILEMLERLAMQDLAIKENLPAVEAAEVVAVVFMKKVDLMVVVPVILAVLDNLAVDKAVQEEIVDM